MAQIHRTTLDPSKLELLTAWLPTRRWFAGEPGTPVLRHVGGYRLDDPAGEVGVEILLVSDDTGATPVLYQVPLTYRGAPLEGAQDALVGTSEHGVLGRRWIYDGTADPVFAGAFVDLLVGRTHAQHRRESDTEEPRVTATTLGPAGHLHLVSHEVLTGEQSNTSLLCRLANADDVELAPVMIKLFRVLSPGENPDVALPVALSRAGSPHVPLVFGYVSSRGLPGVVDDPTTGAEQDDAVYHLAFAQELLVPAEDAFRIAVRHATQGVDLTREAREIGLVTARLHRDLAASLGTEEPREGDRERIVAELRERAALALGEVPELAARDGLVDEIGSSIDAVDQLATGRWPDLQRIHGDLHLGQVLRSHEGWAVIDFEGEPLRPLAERSLPDLPQRDVAGMLRSFDYAGGTALREGADPEAVRDWVRASQAAFRSGYDEAATEGDDPAVTDALVRAFLLDKALYEAVYETRHRPDWLSIPLNAIDHVLDGPGEGPPSGNNGTTDDDVPTTDERS